MAVGERRKIAAYMFKGGRLLEQARLSIPRDPTLLSRLGIVMLGSGETRRAIDLFEHAIHERPAYAPYHLNLAATWRKLGKNHKSILEIERAIELDPLLEREYLMLAEIHESLNRPDEARRALERLLKLRPQNVTAASLLRRYSR